MDNKIITLPHTLVFGQMAIVSVISGNDYQLGPEDVITKDLVLDEDVLAVRIISLHVFDTVDIVLLRKNQYVDGGKITIKNIFVKNKVVTNWGTRTHHSPNVTGDDLLEF